jgi:hypothetical protein
MDDNNIKVQLKLFYPTSEGKRDCQISQFSGDLNFMPDVYFGVSSTLMDRPYPVCNLISVLFSLLHFKFPLHPIYATFHIYKKQNIKN